MSNSITEWEFTADAASWINELISKDPGLPFSQAKCEQRGSGSRKRRDLTLLDDNRVIVLTGEVKLPYQKDGSSPYNEVLVQDARKKAQNAKARFFFTWNINEFVLWETFPAKTAHKDRKYKAWDVTVIHKPSHFETPSILHEIKLWISTFLNEFTTVLRGTTPIGTQPPDEKFIDALESSLKMPITLTLEELESQYKNARARSLLDKWMREEQGWLISDTPEGIRENLERASKFSNYALVNKLVFHEALLKRYGTRMAKLAVPKHIDTGEGLRLHLEGYFSAAKHVTGDYETVFGEDHLSIGNLIPFYSDRAVPHWRELIEQIHAFDFSKLDYEVIGNIFERLISPEERHKYGQFYTRPEVVDLINSFCILKGDEKVMDPACGGGTFLVRAYVRKRELEPRRKHGELLNDLFGVDISHFATHLTTINLATRDLIDEENYPQIARSDFFDVRSGTPFLTLPKRTKPRSKLEHKEIKIELLDAVVGNPPYIRQEHIPRAKKEIKGVPERGTKDYYQWLVKTEAGVELSGRSDIHCYFWPHSASFLKDEGYLCLLTSSQWLDVEYGFKLQEWILRNFEIVAIFESIAEPWFVGARVATTVTVLRKQKDEADRMENVVRFVQLRRPLREILAHDGTTAGAVSAADDFRDKVLALKYNAATKNYRARLVRQGDLWREGVRLGLMMGKSKESGGYGMDAQAGEYYGGKWGVYLRAPDLWFELLDEPNAVFVPLGEIAEVRFGVKSGKDDFFFPIDASDECLEEYEDPKEFKAAYGVTRKQVDSGKIRLVRCGDGRGEIKPLESKYLEPEVHSLMEIKGFTVKPEDCSRQILLVDKKKSQLTAHVKDYIKWGEKKGWHRGATCSARVTEAREWYDLTGHKRGALFWSKSQQYKHAIPLNENNLQCNCNLYDIHPSDGIEAQVMAGILNSSLVVFSKFQFGRPVGVEGNLKTEVVDVNMMLVPDPRVTSDEQRNRVAKAFNKMKKRSALQFLSERRLREMAYKQAGKERELSELSDVCELDMPDRKELDDAVLELLGVKDEKRRQKLINELYSHLRRFFESVRQKEEKAIANKKIAKRKGPARPSEIASLIYDEIAENEGGLLRHYDDFIDTNKPFDTFDLPHEGSPESVKDILSPHGVRFKKGKRELVFIKTKIEEQDVLVVLVASSGVRGLVRVPHEADEAARIYERYRRFINQRERRIRELIESRTADEDMQEKIYEALMPLIVGHHH